MKEGNGALAVDRSVDFRLSRSAAEAQRAPSSSETLGASRRERGASRRERAGARLRDLAVLLKLRVNLVVLWTVWVGFALALRFAERYGLVAEISSGSRFLVLAHVLGGTLLLSCGASILNQVIEVDLDSRMRRTRERPLASGRLRVAPARAAGVLLSAGGLVWLGLAVNPLAASLGALCLVLYAFAYTPLKRLSSLSLFVGAVAGALPPVIGWSAALGSLDGPIGSIFAIQSIWQLPHFLAIAWMYRADYAKAGYRLLTVLDPDGRLVAWQTLVWSLALIPASLAPCLFGLGLGVGGGFAYLAVALALGLVFALGAIRFACRRERRSARALVVISLAYLPLLFLALVITS